jgi:hypothetical protein
MYQGLLRGIPLFSALPNEELRLLSQGLTPAEHPAGAVFFGYG